MTQTYKGKIFAIWLLFFGVLFLPESLGLPWSRVLSVSSAGLMVIFLMYKNLNARILNQKIISLLLFSVLLLIFSVSQSVQVQISLISLAELVILTGTVIIAGIYYKLLDKVIPGILVVLGLFLCGYSFFLNILLPGGLIPFDGYQLVFSRFGSHNHLGDFLVLPMLISLYYLFKKRELKYLPVLLLFFLFFIFSYSRSAYLSFSLTASIFLLRWFLTGGNKLKKAVPVAFASLGIILVLLFSVITVFESGYVTFLNPLHQELVNRYGLRFKHFGANRPEYIKTAIKSIEEKPFFGVGPGNFRYASIKYSSIPNYTTHSSHNIFLDVLTEYGFFIFLLFAGFTVFTVWKLMQAPSLYSYLYLALIINFQTDYTFRIFVLALLFCIFTGIIFKIKKNEV